MINIKNVLDDSVHGYERHQAISLLLPLLPFGILPPFEVLNAYLQSGKLGGGMSGGYEWAPFVITFEDYQLVVENLNVSKSEIPEFVKSKSEWLAWCYHTKFNTPYHDILAAVKREEDARLAWEKAEATEKFDECEKLHQKYIEQSQRLDDLINQFS